MLKGLCAWRRGGWLVIAPSTGFQEEVHVNKPRQNARTTFRRRLSMIQKVKEQGMSPRQMAGRHAGCFPIIPPQEETCLPEPITRCLPGRPTVDGRFDHDT
jgi:hypothetical protein